MKKLISLFRQVTIVFLVGLTVSILQFGYNSNLSARAETVTPEARAYQAKQPGTEMNRGNPLEKAKESLKETAENVREKLNLDEPLDPGTKEVLNSAQKNVEKTVKPVTGKEQGSYQQNMN
ncbi:hypothetical protein C7Y66_12530 [Chroococcidiopsis sp. CCALA 051]|uniref:hypothetical protein n=1 Tax=Chroococcidiopsis sp. CCALA 051 TaxID=869949 RepID=UPI000D0DD7B4|nr:hypothetical protein [Chroococcidiopsis sp. CCALA 051]MBE9015258.1 hypothetical protein [Chroococcidiopsidales cyanobacterium LEGE 13417]PSM48824.1 hypothetical protein C7Y66_12530 [Chroococcidiopsis sp. CCALA 051]